MADVAAALGGITPATRQTAVTWGPGGRASAGTVSLQDVSDLYVALSGPLRQIVRGKIRASDSVVDDACQFAWGSLLHHRDNIRRATALGWLATTATREALRLVRRQGRETSLEALVEAGEAARPRPPTTVIEELVEQRARLGSIGRLPQRQQRLVWLQGFGLSYGEMADHEGASPRTVERQLLRAKKTLREAA